jgi:hypothetical protein
MKPDGRATSLDEIVGAIANELRPWKQTERGAVDDAVREQIGLLQDVSPRFFDRNAVRKMRDDARSIIKTITKLEQQIKGAAPELRLRLKLDVPEMPEIGLALLFEELGYLRKECKNAIQAAPAKDQIKDWCALTAWSLVWTLSDSEPTSTDNSPFRVIAGLLYQAITGKPDKDLRRACDTVHSARLAQKGPQKTSDL